MTVITTTNTEPKLYIWSRTKTTVTEEAHVVQRKRLLDPVKVAKANEEYAKALHQWKDMGGETLRWGYDLMPKLPDYTQSNYYEYITPAIVLDAATKLYIEWEADRAASTKAKLAREASEALLGAYPPKVLA